MDNIVILISFIKRQKLFYLSTFPVALANRSTDSMTSKNTWKWNITNCKQLSVEKDFMIIYWSTSKCGQMSKEYILLLKLIHVVTYFDNRFSLLKSDFCSLKRYLVFLYFTHKLNPVSQASITLVFDSFCPLKICWFLILLNSTFDTKGPMVYHVPYL